jgi:selenocysteine lyase/cysteine desulfurase
LSRRYQVLSYRDRDEERSGIVLFRHPHPERVALPTKRQESPRPGEVREMQSRGLDRRGEDPWHAALLEKLAAQRIIVSMRENGLRVSPHFYNVEAEIDRLLDELP